MAPESRGLPRYRNLPDPWADAATIAARGWHLDDLVLPTLVVRRDALSHNLELLQRWCREHGLDHAPHAKTHLSPELVAAQLAHGVWGMTAATVYQVAFLSELGAPRIILANQVVDRGGLRALAQLVRDARAEVHLLADSVEGVRRVEAAFSEAGARVGVLLELGYPGGRAGIRDDADADAIAREVASAPHLTLTGVEGYEGLVPLGRSPEHVAPVDALVARLGRVAESLRVAGYFAGLDEIILTAGGSVYPDRLALAPRELGGMPVRRVVRAGGSIVHDRGLSADVSPLGEPQVGADRALRPALELWAVVSSVPEPDLAIVGFGKRDAGIDVHLPVVLEVRRDGESRDPGAEVVVERVNDQHAYVRHEGELRVGDVIRFGVFHPCTNFDRWPLIPVVEGDEVVGAITTFF